MMQNRYLHVWRLLNRFREKWQGSLDRYLSNCWAAKHVLTARFACSINIQFWSWSLPSVPDIEAEPGAALQKPCTPSKTVRQFLLQKAATQSGLESGSTARGQGVAYCCRHSIPHSCCLVSPSNRLPACNCPMPSALAQGLTQAGLGHLP